MAKDCLYLELASAYKKRLCLKMDKSPYYSPLQYGKKREKVLKSYLSLSSSSSPSLETGSYDSQDPPFSPVPPPPPSLKVVH